MRYYFNVVTASEEISDPEGTELPSDEAAQAEARIIASQLVSEFPGGPIASSALEIVTQEGRRILAMPLLHSCATP